MHFGAGNHYNIWSFYGKIDEEGKFIFPEEDGFLSRDFIELFLAFSYKNLVGFATVLAVLIANV